MKADLIALLTPLKGKPALLAAIALAIVMAIASTVCSPATAEDPHSASRKFLQASGCGRVETVQHRATGLAVIISAPQYKVRLTEKRPFAKKVNMESLPMPGDSICYEASFYPVYPPTVPGGFDTRSWLKSQGLEAYGKFNHWDVYARHWTFERSFYRFRRWIEYRFSRYLDPSETGLLLGLLAGDKGGISSALRSDFQRTGLVHVLAISGFHVVLLAGMLMTILKATRLPHSLIRILAVLLLTLYIPVTGASPAVRRAVIMFAVPQIGAIFERTPNPLNSLGLALIVIMIPEPSVIWNTGFQLSFAATAGIIIGTHNNPLNSLNERLKHHTWWGLLQSLLLTPTYVTFCATLATAPFLVHHFRTLSPFAWFGNIVVVPCISVAMQAGLFALLSPFDFLASNFCYASRFFLRLAALLTRMLSNSAQASATVGPFGPAVLLLFGACIAILPAIRTNRLARRFAIACLVIFCANFAYNSLVKANNPSWKLTTIDIGQGDSHLITTPSRNHFLIDAGDTNKNTIVPYLHYAGIPSLAALIVTHPDHDHYGGALEIVKTFPVKELWINDCSRIEEKPGWQQVISEAYLRHIPIRDIGRGFLWKENHLEIQALHPYGNRCTNLNAQSITLRVKGLGHSATLTGDLTVAGEKEILKTDMFLKSDVLKLGHHGSKTSSSVRFLEAVAPRVAIVSSGRNNRFHHPSAEIVRRLDSLGIPYVNTAEKGTISITFASDTMLVETMVK